ncbi:MAG: PAS domain S-box protein [Deltaproteobacteria bacterium]|nr:PAS domain S-box protein [Deltaproteobacteria bacterium]
MKHNRGNALSTFFTWVVFIIGVLCACLGAIVLYGWLKHDISLVQLIPESSGFIQPNGALGLFLCGLGLVALSLRIRIVSFLCGLLVVLLGSMTVLEYVYGLELGIDTLLIEPFITTESSYLGRMYFHSALGFSIIGLALLCAHMRRALIFKFALGFIIFALGVIPFLGTHSASRTEFAWKEQRAEITAVAFIAVGLATLFHAMIRQNLKEEKEVKEKKEVKVTQEKKKSPAAVMGAEKKTEEKVEMKAKEEMPQKKEEKVLAAELEKFKEETKKEEIKEEELMEVTQEETKKEKLEVKEEKLPIGVASSGTLLSLAAWQAQVVPVAIWVMGIAISLLLGLLVYFFRKFKLQETEVEKQVKEFMKAKASKDYSDNVISSLADPMIVLTPQKRIKSFNKELLSLVGYEGVELLDKEALVIMKEEGKADSHLITPLKKIMEKGILHNQETIFKTKSGEEIPVSFSGSVMRDEKQNVVALVCIAQDIRGSKQMELEQVKKRLTSEIASKDKELEELKKTMQTQIAEKVGSLEETSRHLQLEVSEKNNELEELKRTLEEKGAEAGVGVGENIDELVAEKTKELQEANNNLELQMAEKNNELEELKHILEQKGTETEKTKELQEANNNLELQMAEKNNELEELKHILEQKGTETGAGVKELEAINNDLQERILEKHQELAEMNRKYKKIESLNKDLERRVESLEKKKEHAKPEKKVSTHMLAEQKESLETEISNRMAELERSRDELQLKIKELELAELTLNRESQVEKLHREIEEMRQKIKAA